MLTFKRIRAFIGIAMIAGLLPLLGCQPQKKTVEAKDGEDEITSNLPKSQKNAKNKAREKSLFKTKATKATKTSRADSVKKPSASDPKPLYKISEGNASTQRGLDSKTPAELKKLISDMKIRNSILTDTVHDLHTRDRKLSKEVVHLRRATEHHGEQIQVAGRIILERDRLKKEVTTLVEQIEKLTQRTSALERLLSISKPIAASDDND